MLNSSVRRLLIFLLGAGLLLIVAMPMVTFEGKMASKSPDFSLDRLETYSSAEISMMLKNPNLETREFELLFQRKIQLDTGSIEELKKSNKEILEMLREQKEENKSQKKGQRIVAIISLIGLLFICVFRFSKADQIINLNEKRTEWGLAIVETGMMAAILLISLIF